MAKLLFHGKTNTLHGKNFAPLQNHSLAWHNFFLLAKPFSFMAKLLLLGKTFQLHG
jgi:hypothetical protein